VRRVASVESVRAAVAEARGRGQRIGLVPTMGYLHEGHLALIDAARQEADYVILSLYVNPLQFGPSEDLARYPRDLERDAELSAGRGVDLLFAPGDEDMYPRGEPRVFVVAPGLDDRLCGHFRPGHFRGVLTVVAKLLSIVGPDVAVFGAKDFQQLVLIRRMVADLDLPVRIVGGAIVREDDGLAMSSRNAYLSSAERADAVALRRALLVAQERFSAGEASARALTAVVRAELEKGDTVRPQYIELVDAQSLDPVDDATAGDVIAIAAFVGRTRLIDNHALS
jgi:pantoate--beta-alanine ligase